MRFRPASLITLAVVALLACAAPPTALPQQVPGIGWTAITTAGDTVAGRLAITIDTVTPRIVTILDTVWLTRTDTVRARTARGGIPVGAYFESSAFSTVLPEPLTLGVGYADRNRLPAELAFFNLNGQRRIPFMVGGPHCQYTTPGCDAKGKMVPGSRFDLAKWKAKLRTFDTPAVKVALAQAVADGTVLVHFILDEPSNVTANNGWGGVFGGRTLEGASRKGVALLEEMAAFSDSIFTSALPTAVVATGTYFGADSLPPFKYLDAIYAQYDAWQGSSSKIVGPGTQGLTEVQKVRRWAATMASIGARKNVALLYGFNVINGGVQLDTLGTCPTPLTGGKGTEGRNCRMSAAQVRDWGMELLGGCAFLYWKDEPVTEKVPVPMMRKPEYVEALGELATAAAARPTTPCRRTA